MPGVPNAFEACVFTFGIAQAGGAGKVLAEWVTEGQTEWDMWSCDPRRFTAFAASKDYCVAKGMEVYGHEYAIQFPSPCLASGAQPETLADPRPDCRARRAVQCLQWLGARHLVCASPATTLRKTATQTLRPRRPVGAAHPRGMPRRARCRRHSRPPRFFAVPPAWPRRARMAVDDDHRHRAEARPHRPRLFRRRQGPHRHRNVDHGDRRGFFFPHHGGGRGDGTISSGCRSICRKTRK